MKRYQSSQQTLLAFALPFEGKLNPQNRWVLLGNHLPWDDLVKIYLEALDERIGRPSIDGRVAMGALFIKHLRNLSDAETIELISENPYMQFFLGLPGFQQDKIFDSSLFVSLRKRLGEEKMDKMNTLIMLSVLDLDGKIAEMAALAEKKAVECEPETKKEGEKVENITNNTEKSTESTGKGSKIATKSKKEPKKRNKGQVKPKKETQKAKKLSKRDKKAAKINTIAVEPTKKDKKTGEITHKGQLKIDATVAPQHIAFPTDVDLLNQGRMLSEELIDLVCSDKKLRKPRTYRENARRDYLTIARNRRKTKQKIRIALRQQLNYLGRNLLNISTLLKENYPDNTLPKVWTTAQQTQYKTIILLHEQQHEMYKTKKQSCANRIVSLSQAYVRPIVRGKAHRNTEFGAKLGLSTYNGLLRLDHISWDAYNETSDLSLQVERYHALHGYFPESVNADKIYATRANYTYLGEKGIRFIGKSLGRTPKAAKTAQAKRETLHELGKRNHIEGKIGQAKNAYGLDCIKAKTETTSETWIAACVLVTNLVTLLRRLHQLFLSPTRYTRFLLNIHFFTYS